MERVLRGLTACRLQGEDATEQEEDEDMEEEDEVGEEEEGRDVAAGVDPGPMDFAAASVCSQALLDFAVACSYFGRLGSF
jgi:hypothetical protein